MKRILILVALVVASCAMPQTREQLRPHFDGKIVGGKVIDIKEAPFQASLQIYGYHYCGGSIISSRFVMTAAHCVAELSTDSFTVRIGSSRWIDGGEVLRVRKIHQHKKYNANTVDYDFSILELATAIEFDETKQPIGLPKPDESVVDGTLLDVSGWGDTKNPLEFDDSLRHVVVPKANQLECHAALKKWGNVTDRMICAGYKEGGKDSCQADSGGPLSVNNTLVGVVSWGRGCAQPNLPGVYARVAAVVDWVNAFIQE